MTEKRFKYTFEGIEDTLESDEEYKYTSCNKDGFQDLCVMLNELHEENEELKQENKELQGKYDKQLWIYNGLGCEYDQLKEENEQLKQFKNEVFKLIDKRIDKCEPTDYARNIKGDFPVFDCETATEIRVLNELKRELLDD